MMRKILSSLLGVLLLNSTFAQGRVVINEYMPWPSNSCGTGAEFVELFNIGPGPVNIGCWILTDGDYAITIPSGTVISPGGFYLLGGMDLIPSGCANVDKPVPIDLNWYTCGCTSGSIPSTGDGLFTDGGFANEQVVLMDNTGKVVDAVVRDLPQESSSLISVNILGGSCSPRVFDLDNLAITYETIGASAGRGNSFSRLNDADCGWDKTPPMSGGQPNSNTGTRDLDVIYTLNYPSCPGNANVLFTFSTTSSSNYTLEQYFPMTYTLAFDANHNGTFEEADTYTYGNVPSPPSFMLTDLPAGNYSILFSPVTGCGYNVVNFSFLDCISVLPVKLIDFSGRKDRMNNLLTWKTDHTEMIDHFELMSTTDGSHFSLLASVKPVTGSSGIQSFNFTHLVSNNNGMYYRLTSVGKDHVAAYSNIVYLEPAQFDRLFIQSVAPNPVNTSARLNVYAASAGNTDIELYDMTGKRLLLKRATVNTGINTILLDLSSIPKGIYHLSVSDSKDGYRNFSRIIKD